MANNSSFFESLLGEINAEDVDSDLDGEESDNGTVPYVSDDETRDENVDFQQQQQQQQVSSESEIDDVPTAGKRKRKNNTNAFPPGFDPDLWQMGNSQELEKLPEFEQARCGFNFDISADNVGELFLFEQFVTDELIHNITNQTNLYFTQATADKELPRNSRLAKFKPIRDGKMCAFLAITFYMGLVKKSDLKHYWSVDTALETPFVRSVMPQDEFMNIFIILPFK